MSPIIVDLIRFLSIIIVAISVSVYVARANTARDTDEFPSYHHAIHISAIVVAVASLWLLPWLFYFLLHYLPQPPMIKETTNKVVVEAN